MDVEGENRAVWAKATRSAGVFVCLLMAGAARCGAVYVWDGKVVCAASSDNNSPGRFHSPWVFLGHWIVVPAGVRIVQVVLVNVTSHPLSHKGATASNEFCSVGKMWACRAVAGMPVMGRSAVCVEYMCCWFATCTAMGRCAGLRLCRG